MNVRTSAIKGAKEIICERIADRVNDLIAPSTTRETQWVMADDGSRLVPQVTTIEHPSLLDQLRDAPSASTAGTSSSGYGSRPVANIEALSTLDLIMRHAAECVRDDLGHAPSTIVANLVRLVAEAHTLDRDTLRALDDDVRSWWARARVTTTWDSAPLKPFVTCMTCNSRGDLRVRVDPLAAVCLACGSTWDSATIGILGQHIQIMLADPIPDPPPPQA